MNWVMRSLAVAVGFVILSAGASSGADTSPLLTAFLSTEFEKVAHIDAIPDTISTALATVLSGKHLVDPAYLDKATNTWKPNTADRLLFAGKAPGLWFVYFERQGSEPSTHLVVFQVTNGAAILEQEHVITSDLAFSLPALKSMIRAKQYTIAGRLVPSADSNR